MILGLKNILQIKNTVMKYIKKILKWFSLAIGVFILIVVLAGLVSRVFTPEPQPPGQLVDVGGYQLHIQSTGAKNNKPTLVIESGAGSPGEHLHWLSEGLKDSIRVVRYDRAGIGYSDFGNSTSNVEDAAHDLRKLLELTGETPPYIMAGHSYGGHYIRIFTELYPEDVVGMVFLDSSHPNSSERLKLPSQPWFMDPMYKVGAVIADLGVLHLFDKIKGPILWAPGLPEEINDSTRDYTYDGKFIRGFLKRDGNDDWVENLLASSSASDDFGSLPIQVFSGTHQRDKALKRRGVDPEHFRKARRELQEAVSYTHLTLPTKRIV